MTGRITFSILDHSNEVGSVRMYTPPLDASNIDAYVDDTVGGKLGNMRIVLNALIEGNHLARTVQATRIPDAATLPADESAQRERKAQVNYRDTVTGKSYHLEIPTFNMAGAEPGTDIIDKDHVAWAAFILAFEADFVSELGNPVQVTTVKHVGRSS